MADKRKRMFGSRKLSDILPQISDDVFKKRAKMESALMANWPSIIGAELACISIPKKVVFPRNEKDSAVLVLQVDSAESLKVQSVSSVILERIAVYFGFSVIRKIKIIQSTNMAKNVPIGKEKMLDSSGNSNITDHDCDFSGIKDEGLSSALYKLMSDLKTS